jgi:mRNA interferase MazF
VATKEQGQVWWANLPEPVGYRPVLILTRTDAIPHLNWVTVAPLTRSIRGIKSEVILEPADGVPQRCVVTLDNIATIEPAALLQQITTLSAQRMNEVWEALYDAFDLPF